MESCCALPNIWAFKAAQRTGTRTGGTDGCRGIGPVEARSQSADERWHLKYCLLDGISKGYPQKHDIS